MSVCVYKIVSLWINDICLTVEVLIEYGIP